MILLADVLEALTGIRPATATQPVGEGIIDSRQASPGSIFVALPGEHHDGHDFVGEAFAAGARYAIVKREMGSEFLTLDLRLPVQPDDLTDRLNKLKTPFCIRVENPLSALQRVAEF